MLNNIFSIILKQMYEFTFKKPFLANNNAARFISMDNHEDFAPHVEHRTELKLI